MEKNNLKVIYEKWENMPWAERCAMPQNGNIAMLTEMADWLNTNGVPARVEMYTDCPLLLLEGIAIARFAFTHTKSPRLEIFPRYEVMAPLNPLESSSDLKSRAHSRAGGNPLKSFGVLFGFEESGT